MTPSPSHDRRLGFRVPLELMMTSYVRERAMKAVTADVSDTGLRLHAVSPMAPLPGTVVGLELELPGTGDTIWAAGEVCYRVPDDLASGLGVRFTAMARSHARLVRDFCVERRRAHLGDLLGRSVRRRQAPASTASGPDPTRPDKWRTGAGGTRTL